VPDRIICEPNDIAINESLIGYTESLTRPSESLIDPFGTFK
jgi:hypothetical protein